MVDKALFQLVMLLGCVGAIGCSSPTWGDWRFARIENRDREFPVSIRTKPGASVYVDGKLMGKGPCTFSLPYAQQVVIKERNLVDSDGSIRSTETEEANVTVLPMPYVLEIRDPDSDPKFVPLIVPRPSNEPIAITLKPIRYVGAQNVECKLTIVARPQYFAEIKSIIKKHAVPGFPSDESSQQQKELGIVQQTFTLVVRDIGAFSMLVDDLQELGRSNKFVFTITNEPSEQPASLVSSSHFASFALPTRSFRR